MKLLGSDNTCTEGYWKDSSLPALNSHSIDFAPQVHSNHLIISDTNFLSTTPYAALKSSISKAVAAQNHTLQRCTAQQVHCATNYVHLISSSMRSKPPHHLEAPPVFFFYILSFAPHPLEAPPVHFKCTYTCSSFRIECYANTCTLDAKHRRVLGCTNAIAQLHTFHYLHTMSFLRWTKWIGEASICTYGAKVGGTKNRSDMHLMHLRCKVVLFHSLCELERSCMWRYGHHPMTLHLDTYSPFVFFTSLMYNPLLRTTFGSSASCTIFDKLECTVNEVHPGLHISSVLKHKVQKCGGSSYSSNHVHHISPSVVLSCCVSSLQLDPLHLRCVWLRTVWKLRQFLRCTAHTEGVKKMQGNIWGQKKSINSAQQ